MANEVVIPETMGDIVEIVSENVKERTTIKADKPDTVVLNRSLRKTALSIKDEINRSLKRAHKTTSLNSTTLVNSMKTNVVNTPNVEVTLIPKYVEPEKKVDPEVTLEVDKSEPKTRAKVVG